MTDPKDEALSEARVERVLLRAQCVPSFILLRYAHLRGNREKIEDAATVEALIADRARLLRENAELRQDLSDARTGWEEDAAQGREREETQQQRIEELAAELGAWADETLSTARGMGSGLRAYPAIPPSAAKELRRIAAALQPPAANSEGEESHD